MASISDVAKLAGVGTTTVSRVINRSGYVSKETYDKVMAAIEKLEYSPNQLGKNL
ncbi:MAG: LacI family DNA-binding transcriptional regulator, partial [Acholeplasmatales bacterium]|nr:LacI family DNA-binding transcriptional regulator [Acholeplasmatales bacterium]